MGIISIKNDKFDRNANARDDIEQSITLIWAANNRKGQSSHV